MLESDIKKLTVAVVQLTEALHCVRLPSAADLKKTSAPVATPEANKTDTSVSTPEPTPSVEDAFSAIAVGAAAAKPEAPGPAVADIPPPEAVAVATEVPTKKEMVEKFIEMAQNQPREVAITLLAKYKIAKLPELIDKTQWAPFLADCVALLAAAEAAAK